MSIEVRQNARGEYWVALAVSDSSLIHEKSGNFSSEVSASNTAACRKLHEPMKEVRSRTMHKASAQHSLSALATTCMTCHFSSTFVVFCYFFSHFRR